MIVYSPAKLNLYLEVLNKRSDGYHNIYTIFEKIALLDKIEIKSRPDNIIKIISDSPDIPKDKNNIVDRAALFLKKDFNISDGVNIKIKKNIPVGAGLGGGSANGAAVLIALDKFWKLNLSISGLLKYAARLGSDVAFFLYKESFAIGSGRGERIKPIKAAGKKFWHIVVVPRVKALTKDVYRELGLDNIRRKFSINSKEVRNLDFPFFNRLEEVTFKKFPQVKKIKDNLEKLGARNVLMSGSGSSVFGIVGSRKEGLEKAEFFKGNKNLRVFVVRTY